MYPMNNRIRTSRRRTEERGQSFMPKDLSQTARHALVSPFTTTEKLENGAMKMKRTKKPATAATPTRNSTVRLQYHVPEAKRVCVVGSFNDWQPDAAPMEPRVDGLWTIDLELPPGTYEYRCVVDGCWCDDPILATWRPWLWR
jgi:hypothetical protein